MTHKTAFILLVVVAVFAAAWIYGRNYAKAMAPTQFATKPDGTPDYSRNADGTPVAMG